MQPNWKGLLNLLISAAIAALIGFIGAITAVPGIPTKASLAAAGFAALVAVVQHLRKNPNIWKSLIVLSLMFALAGCAVGYAAPGYVNCKGKGVITGSGAIHGAAIYGAAGGDNVTLMVDCGDGLYFEQGKVTTDKAPMPIPVMQPKQ